MVRESSAKEEGAKGAEVLGVSYSVSQWPFLSDITDLLFLCLWSTTAGSNSFLGGDKPPKGKRAT